MKTAKRVVGISHGGKSAEERYRQLTGASVSPKTGSGDAILEGTYIEVKKATTATLNQVRALKYIPLIAYHEPTGAWYVIPAHIVVCLVSMKSRGQHTENPFECATLSLSSLGKYRVSSETELKRATLHAIAEAEKYPELKSAMAHVLAESQGLAQKYIARVRSLIVELKITP